MKRVTSFIFIFWGDTDKKICSLRRYFSVPTTYAIVEAFKVFCKDISFIVVLFDLWNSCKRLQNFSHICNYGFIFWVLKKRLIETALLSLIFFVFQRYKLYIGIIYYDGRSLLYCFHF